jgi:hypothetical protein
MTDLDGNSLLSSKLEKCHNKLINKIFVENRITTQVIQQLTFPTPWRPEQSYFKFKAALILMSAL